MMPALTIARLAVLEITRRRLILAMFILTAIIIGFTGWGFSRLPVAMCANNACAPAEIKTTAASLLMLVAFMFNFVLALGATFLAAPAVAADVESGIVLAILPRPIRRSDLVLGKWLGLGLVLVLYTLIACSLEYAAVALTTGYVPPHPGLTIAYLCGEAIILLTLALLGSTRLPPITVGISALILYGLVWLGGIAGAIGQALQNTTIANIGTISSLLLPTDGLWRGAVFNLEPAALAAALGAGGVGARSSPFAVVAPPPTAYVIWAIGWVVVILCLSMWSFERREL